MSGRSTGAQAPSILHVSQPTDAGVAEVVASLASDQLGRGWRVSVASPPGPLADDVQRAGASWASWPAGRTPGPGTLAEIHRLRRILRSIRPDVVHLHSSKAGLAGRLVVRGRVPTIFEPHAWSFHAAGGAVRTLTIAWERAASRWATVTVCVSDAERRQGIETGIRGNWRVVPNGVDTARLTVAGDAARQEARSRLGLPADDGLVVCIGRLAVQKGQDVLLRSWPLVRSGSPRARLVLVGDGPLRDRLAGELPDGATLAGQRDDVEEWLAAADVVALPSRWEGMSLALLEAMACGRAVVATDVAGAREALGEAASAVVTVESPEALAAGILARLNDPVRRAREGAANRAIVEARYSLAQMCETIAALTLELVS